MCRTCGCGGRLASEPASAREQHHAHAHAESHALVRGHRAHDHGPKRDVEAGSRAILRLQQRVLEKNDTLASRNRQWLADRGVLALNWVSSPGAGKTTLLERLVERARDRFPLVVIQGDQATERDADRIRRAGAPALQLNTGEGCHLDAAMIAASLERLPLEHGSLLVIENVGNLVCPALFDLGEYAKLVIVSVTEGADKPIKYPHMFRASRAMVISKLDLLPHVPFDVDECIAFARQVNPAIEALQLSALRGDGMDALCDWLAARRAELLTQTPEAQR